MTTTTTVTGPEDFVAAYLGPYQNRPFDALQALAELHEVIERAITEAVVESRHDGATWEEVGQTVGITRQAASWRWRKTVMRTQPTG